MRTSKKIISGISAFVVAVSSIAITVSAVTNESSDLTISISSESTYVEAGQDFQVAVDLSNVPDTGIAGCEFAVYFDVNTVEFKDIVENDDIVGTADDVEIGLVPDLSGTMVNGSDYSCFDYYVNNGKVACLWATGLENSAYWINNDGTLATLTFTAKEDLTQEDIIEIGIKPILDDGSVLFASADENGTYYAYENVSVDEPITISVGQSSTTETTTEDTSVNIGQSGTTLYGDVNCDGSVKSNDLLMLKKNLLGLVDLTDQGTLNADVTHDAKVASNDLLKLKKFLLGLVETLN